MVEKGKSMMSREERSHMRHRAHTRSSLAGGKARGRRTSGGQNESSPRILPKPDAYQCTHFRVLNQEYQGVYLPLWLGFLQL